MFNSIFSVWGIYLQLMQTPILPLKGELQVDVSLIIRSFQLTSIIHFQYTRGDYTYCFIQVP